MSQTAVTKVDGDYFDLPGTVVYTQAKKSLPEKGRLEINVSDPSVRDRFTWNAEITLDRRSNDIFKHILLNGDGSVVETYGKRVIEVTDETAAELLNQLATAAKL
ncbi:MAG TPA: hypothetical protein VLF21_03565 [Candidatus Saccharimonadales bacterium]|nr:hypothetical protein [Candidatus Saccharimonadales bacterium]